MLVISTIAYLPLPSTSPNFTMFDPAILYSCSSFTSGGSSSAFRSSSLKSAFLVSTSTFSEGRGVIAVSRTSMVPLFSV